MRRLLCAAAAVPFLLVGAGTSRLVDRLGEVVGASLGQGASALHEALRVAPPPSLAESELGPATPTEMGVATMQLDLPRTSVGRGSAEARSASPRRGIRVRAATVLRLSRAGARPSATLVPAEGARPAGLAMVGVSGLGVGVRDGDVLTEVDGAPATSVEAVVRAVVAARSARAAAVGGRFFRDGESFALVVEMPYVD